MPAGKHMHLRLKKRPGKEKEDVLQSSKANISQPDGAGGSVWDKVTSFLSHEGSGSEAGADDNRVHIFTVASGHMYERLQKIMILSVVRNTK
jgi:UDP-glucose:glycoprotein glucosyltransferase